MSIKVNEITKLYGTQKALDSVTFEIAPGEVVGLLGPNGAGKSTIMKILTCFIPPTSGDASVCNYDILEQSIEVRKKVGYLPENNPLYLDLYVPEYLSFIAKIRHEVTKVVSQDAPVTKRQTKVSWNGTHRITQKRVDEIIGITGLGAERHKKIGALSKGFRQRVGLAQALLHDPEVLILDEPTSGLDPNQLMEIRTLIKEIGKEKTVMLSTHIMQEVEAICNRAIIIHNGKIVADDSTANLHHMVSSRTIINVEFSVRADPLKLKNIKGVIEVKHLSGDNWQLKTDSSRDIRPDVFKYAVDNNLTVLSLQKDEVKLEEVFQELTKS
ncbi:MAG: ATP-binding cassette domain-containing protein [Bacteroidetes bacterium]|nr:ATP-binding cassette domain-containing protein [Bacteroidota bacterium]